jgi:UDP-glucuronate decarboxylase
MARLMSLARLMTPVIESDVKEISERAATDLAWFDGKTVLITGGAGFLLSYLVDVLARRATAREGAGPRVLVIDNFITGVPDRLKHLQGHPAVKLITGDVSKALELPEPCDVIIHGASIASPLTYRTYPLRTAEVNALGTHHLLHAARAQAERTRPVSAFVLLSTSEIYGDPDPAHIPTKETYRGFVSCTGPRACYDESKRFAETLAVIFAEQHQLPTRMIRPFNVYGPGMRLDDARVLPDYATCVLENRDVVLLSDGTPTRSFCYITDFMVGLLAVTARGGAGEPYNIGNDREEVAMRDLARMMIDASGRPLQLRFARSEDAHYLTDNPQRRCPDLGKLRALSGYQCQVDLRDGLRRYLAWAEQSGELARIAAAKRAAGAKS